MSENIKKEIEAKLLKLISDIESIVKENEDPALVHQKTSLVLNKIFNCYNKDIIPYADKLFFDKFPDQKPKNITAPSHKIYIK